MTGLRPKHPDGRFLPKNIQLFAFLYCAFSSSLKNTFFPGVRCLIAYLKKSKISSTRATPGNCSEPFFLKHGNKIS